MDLRLAQRLSEHERYQFLALFGRVETRPNQIRNYVALKKMDGRIPRAMDMGVFVDGEWRASSSCREYLDWVAERALNNDSTVLVADFGAGEEIRLFIDEGVEESR